MSIFDRVYGSASELDLDNISAADFIKMAQAEEEELDLSDLSAAELLMLQEELEADEYEDTVEKVAEALYGTEEWMIADALGRVQAHAQLDELSKIAGADDDEFYVDLNELSADEFLELQEAGYEFYDADLEKEAGEMGDAARMAGRRLRDLVTFKNARGASGRIKRLQKVRDSAAPGGWRRNFFKDPDDLHLPRHRQKQNPRNTALMDSEIAKLQKYRRGERLKGGAIIAGGAAVPATALAVARSKKKKKND